MVDANEAIREEELVAVRSIYGNDWHDIPPVTTKWGTQVEEGWWGVTVRAEQGRVSVQVRGRLAKKYPDQPPYLKLHEPVGLSGDNVRELLRLLQQKARELIGQTMIFDLASFAEMWITDNHIPMRKAGEPQRTLMEEKAIREEAQRAAEDAQSQAEYEKSIAAALEEDRLLNAKIKLDDSLNKEKKQQQARQVLEKTRQQALAALKDGELSSREVNLDHSISVEGYQGSWAAWTLFGGKREMLWTTYLAEPIVKDGSIDENFVRTTLPTLWVQIIDFSNPFYSTEQGKKRIESLVTEIQRLRDTQSDHVLQVYAAKRTKSPKDHERLMIFVERPVEGGLLKSRLPKDGFDEHTATEYFTQIMTGLSCLHRRNQTQRLFDSTFVAVSCPRPGETVVKLMGTSYAKKIIDLHKSNPFLQNFMELNSANWASPDELNYPQDYTPKRDMYNSALLLIELLVGSEANWAYPNIELVRKNRYIPDQLYQILVSLLNLQAKKRPTPDEVLDKLLAIDQSLTMTRPQLKASTSSHNSITSPLDSPNALKILPSNEMFPAVAQHGFRTDRYKADYEELEKLGQGGFGTVVKARNRLDALVYAVKKIKLREEDKRDMTDREIQVLSIVNHKHVVRYFNCWIEEPQGPVKHSNTEDVESSASTPQAADSGSDIFAPGIPNDPFAYKSADNSTSLRFPDTRYGVPGRSKDPSRNKFWASADSDDDSDEEGSVEDSGSDSGEETESEHPIAKPNEKRNGVVSASVPSSALTDASSADPGSVRTLYIAMEFVDNGTLRELIDSQLSTAESWRLFAEVLEALSYLHDRNIVHRDLKPSNILINAKRQAVVADFGLSTFSSAAIETADHARSGLIDINSSKTSNIGTAAYIAPEVMAGRSYDAKCDLFSLGVIFFEMNFPPMMGQERARTISHIRSPSIIFPASWPAAQVKQRDLITWLLAHDPASRPSADTVLASPLMPAEHKTPAEYAKAISTLTTDRKSDQYRRLVYALFRPPEKGPIKLVDERLANWVYDLDPDDHEEATEVWSAVIIQRLKELFRRHGAQETYLPTLMPETRLLDLYPADRPVRLLDTDGKLVQLVECDLIAMARSVPRRHVGRRKRFHLGMQHSQFAPGRHPLRAAELSFDIVSPLRSAAAEVEMIEVVDKVIAEFQGGRTSENGVYEFHINHESVLSTVLSIVPMSSRNDLLEACKSIGVTESYDKGRNAMKRVTGVTQQTMNSLVACCSSGDFYEIRKKLEVIFASGSGTNQRRLRDGLNEMEVIVKLLGQIQIGRKIVFRPMLANNAELFRGGFMFECVRIKKHRDVLAFGGRYDSLLRHFDNQQSTTHGVAMSVSVDHLAQVVSTYESSLSKDLMARDKEEERSFGYWNPSRCDVYVAAGVQVDLSTRMKIIAELWRNGISADLQYDDDRTLDDLTEECEAQSTPFLVMPRSNRSEVKIRSILRKTEKEVPRADLCTQLRAMIAEQRRIDATYASMEGSIPSSQAASLSVDPRLETNLDIRLILPPEPQSAKGTKGRPVRKFRHGTKSVYWDKANQFVQTTKSSLPVVGVDLPIQILSQLALDSMWITEDETWKPVLADKAVGDRKYAEQVREGVRKLVEEDGQTVFWLFGVREGRGFLVQTHRA